MNNNKIKRWLNMRKTNQKGIAHLILIVVFFVFIALVGLTAYVINRNNNDKKTKSNSAQTANKPVDTDVEFSKDITIEDPSINTKDWLEVVSTDKNFTLKLPDGYSFASSYLPEAADKVDGIPLYYSSQLISTQYPLGSYVPGQKAIVEQFSKAPNLPNYNEGFHIDIQTKADCSQFEKYAKSSGEGDLNDMMLKRFIAENNDDKKSISYTYCLLSRNGNSIAVTYDHEKDKSSLLNIVQALVRTIRPL